MRYLVALTLALLTACGPTIKTDYELKPPASTLGKQCAAACVTTYAACKKSCKKTYHDCEISQQLNSESDYNDYIMRAAREGRVAAQSEKQFDRHYLCSEDPCIDRCGQTERTCHTTCGGTVIPHNICTANCSP